MKKSALNYWKIAALALAAVAAFVLWKFRLVKKSPVASSTTPIYKTT